MAHNVVPPVNAKAEIEGATRRGVSKHRFKYGGRPLTPNRPSSMAAISSGLSDSAPRDGPSSWSRDTAWSAALYAVRREETMRMKSQGVRWARGTRALQRL